MCALVFVVIAVRVLALGRICGSDQPPSESLGVGKGRGWSSGGPSVRSRLSGTQTCPPVSKALPRFRKLTGGGNFPSVPPGLGIPALVGWIGNSGNRTTRSAEKVYWSGCCSFFFFSLFPSEPAAHDAKLIFQWRSQRSASSSVGTDSTRKVIAYHCCIVPAVRS